MWEDTWAGFGTDECSSVSWYVEYRNRGRYATRDFNKHDDAKYFFDDLVHDGAEYAEMIEVNADGAEKTLHIWMD